MDLGELGKHLRSAGLSPRALNAWAGTERISLLAQHVDALAAREPTPAAIALSLFVAGRDIAIDKARAVLPVDALLAHELVDEDHRSDVHEDRGPCLRANVAILPVGPSLLVCDRFDAPPTTERVCWPDDSSYHLAASIPPGRVDRWIDLGCGSAFAALARPELAREIVGVELNPSAARMARLGAALSGVSHVTIEDADLAIDLAPAALVTCNAPIPGDGIEMWRNTGDDFFTRLWQVVPDRTRDLAVIHAKLAVVPYERLPGERVLVRYTPDDVPAFGVLWWRPAAEDRLVVKERMLTADRPHLDADDK